MLVPSYLQVGEQDPAGVRYSPYAVSWRSKVSHTFQSGKALVTGVLRGNIASHSGTYHGPVERKYHNGSYSPLTNDKLLVGEAGDIPPRER